MKEKILRLIEERKQELSKIRLTDLVLRHRIEELEGLIKEEK